MKVLLRVVVLAVAMFVVMPVQAQKEMVVDRSDKRRAEWIGCSTSSTIAVTEIGNTLAEAQDKALSSIRQYIINGVAVSVSSHETMVSRQITHDRLYSVMNDYTSVLMTEAARLPYINDISLSNAVDIYWEKIYSKATKSYRYEYSVCYPFDEDARAKLVEAFLYIDGCKEAELAMLRNKRSTITNLDDIKRAVNDLDALYEYFFDDTRRSECLALRKSYSALYSQVSIEVEAEGVGECIYSLRLASRRVTTSIPVRLKSDSALDMSVSAIEGGCYRLTYDPTYASPRDINTIDISYPMGTVRVSRTITFEAPESK